MTDYKRAGLWGLCVASLGTAEAAWSWARERSLARGGVCLSLLPWPLCNHTVKPQGKTFVYFYIYIICTHFYILYLSISYVSISRERLASIWIITVGLWKYRIEGMWEGGTPGRLGRLSPGPLDVLLSLKEGGLCPAAAPAVCLLCSRWPTHSEHPSPNRTWPSPIPLALGFRGHRAALQAVAFSHELTFTKGFLVPPFLQAPSAPCGETAWPWERAVYFCFFTHSSAVDSFSAPPPVLI